MTGHSQGAGTGGNASSISETGRRRIARLAQLIAQPLGIADPAMAMITNRMLKDLEL